MAAITSAVVGVGTLAVGAYGANKQAKAAQAAGNQEMAQYYQTREDMLGQLDKLQSGTNEMTEAYNPYIQAGSRADQLTQALSGALGAEAQAQAYQQYQESPDVQWQREQGMKGLENDLAMRGAGGGSRLKALSQYNQGLATQSFSDAYNRLASQGDVGRAALQDQINSRINALGAGLTTAQQVGQFGAQSTTNANLANTAAAQAQADRAGSIMEGLQSGLSMYKTLSK